MTPDDEDDWALWAFHSPLTGSFTLYEQCRRTAEPSSPAVLRLNMAQPLLGNRVANAAACLLARLIIAGNAESRERLLEGLLAGYSEGGSSPRGSPLVERIPREEQIWLTRNVVSTFWLSFSVSLVGAFHSQAFRASGESPSPAEAWRRPLRDVLLAAFSAGDGATRLLAARTLAIVCLCSDRRFAEDVLRQFEVSTVPPFHCSAC